MRRSYTIPLSLALSAAVLACGESGPTWHADVKPIFDARCVNCHTDGGIAPFVLTSYGAAKSWAPAIKRAVTERTMPPWLAAAGCTEYQGDKSLTDAQIATIAGWADGGAPEGSPDDAPTGTAETEGGLSRVDHSLEMPVAYAPRQAPDDYRCFLIDWPETTDKFVTGFQAKPGNASIVHHVVAYLIAPEDVASYEQLDADEEGEGYTCFGGPGGDASQVNWLGAWAPGNEGLDFPAGTGQRVKPGSKIALQIHYNVANATSGETDQTSVEVKVDDTVEKEAFTLPYTNPAWAGFLGPSTMTIPAGEKEATHSFSADPSGFLARFSRGVLENGESFLIHSAFLHMHTLGVRGEVQLIKQGENECMLDIDRWDFGWQQTYRFKEPKRFDPGDEIFIECTWDNSGAKHAARSEVKDVAWGEGTGDEMCLGVLYISKL